MTQTHGSESPLLYQLEDKVLVSDGCWGVNPAHREVVTMRLNILRGDAPAAQNARKTECVRGHPLDGDVWLDKKGGRHCRACRRERALLKRRLAKGGV